VYKRQRWICGKYREVIVKDIGVIVESGTLDDKEAEEVGLEFLEASLGLMSRERVMEYLKEGE
jgi:hypothetical protein